VARRNSKDNEPPRKSQRAERFTNTLALRAAVRSWCCVEILRRSENPEFDLAKLSAQVAAWAAEDAAKYGATTLWLDLCGVVAKCIAYVDAHAEKTKQPGHAALLAAFLSALSTTDADPVMRPIRERFAPLLLNEIGERASRRELTKSLRTRIVRTFYSVPRVLWWGDKRPAPRDLALLTLLTGCFPLPPENKARRAAQGKGTGPTVLDVLRAEQTAVRAALRNLQKVKQAKTQEGR
jgi:hypothetical protein